MAALVDLIETEDHERWRRELRDDIFHILENESPLWVGDHLVSSKTGRTISGCPFLVWEEGRYSCEIYETRPMVCRRFMPGSSEICPLWKK